MRRRLPIVIPSAMEGPVRSIVTRIPQAWRCADEPHSTACSHTIIRSPVSSRDKSAKSEQSSPFPTIFTLKLRLQTTKYFLHTSQHWNGFNVIHDLNPCGCGHGSAPVLRFLCMRSISTRSCSWADYGVLLDPQQLNVDNK